MKRSARLLACLCIALPLAAAEPPAPPPAPAIEHTLEVADTGLESLQRQIWQGHDISQSRLPDAAGRRIADDLDEYVLTEDARKKLETLRAALPAAIPEGSKIIDASAWDPFEAALEAEFCRFNLIGLYWTINSGSQHHREMIERLVTSLPEANAAAARAALDAIPPVDSSYRERIFPKMSLCPDMLAALQSLDDLRPVVYTRYNELRTSLIGQLTDPSLGKSAWVDRTDECGPPAASTSGKRSPAYARRPEVDKYYPPQERAFQVEGVVRVLIAIDTQGCVRATAINQSSGSDQLDDAGRKVAENMSFLPSEQDGKAVKTEVIVPIRFSLFAQPQP